MKKIFIIACCGLLFSPAFARTETVKSTGYGSSEYNATINAIDNAIRQNSTISGTGTQAKIIDANYKTEDTRNIKAKSKSWWKFWEKDQGETEESFEYKGGETNGEIHVSVQDINQKYSGQIEGYKVISMREKDGKYTAEIEAKIFVVDDYQSPDLVKKSKYRVAVSEFEGKKTWSCLTDSMIISPLEKALTKSKKLTLVDRKNFDKQMKELNLIADGLTDRENESKLNQIAIADYILVGKIDNFQYSKTNKKIELTGEKISKTSATLEVSYKLIETATMEIVSSDSVIESVEYNSEKACSSIANTLTKKVATEMADILLDDLFD